MRMIAQLVMSVVLGCVGAFGGTNNLDLGSQEDRCELDHSAGYP